MSCHPDSPLRWSLVNNLYAPSQWRVVNAHRVVMRTMTARLMTNFPIDLPAKASTVLRVQQDLRSLEPTPSKLEAGGSILLAYYPYKSF